MFELFKNLFGTKKKKRKTSSHKSTSGRVAVLGAETYNNGPMHSMEAVTALPTWYLNNNSFDHIQFSYPSEGMLAPVIRPEDRELLMRYVRDVCPEPDSSIAIYHKLNDPDASVKEIAALVSSDPMLAAQVLRLVNSAAFGVVSEVTSVGRAVTLLGFQNVKSVVLNHSIRKGVTRVESDLAHRVREHSTMCSSIAYHLAEKTPGVDRFTASTLALLHDMGKLLWPMITAQGKGITLTMSVPDQVVESLIASVFAEIWKLPATITQALEYSHYPYFYPLGAVPIEIRKQVTVLSMSNLLANAMGYSDGENYYMVKNEYLDEIQQVGSPARWIDGAMAAKIEQFRGVLR